MKKNILFITCNGVEDQAYGGAKASRRNYMTLKKYAEVDVYTIEKRSNYESAMSLLSGYFPPISNRDFQCIKEKLENKAYDVVFFDGSYYGKIVEYVHKKGIKSIIFYHNCELDYIDVRFGKKNSIKKWLYKKSIYSNEKNSSIMGDYRIAFSERDARRIKELYKVNVEKIIPLSIVDIYEKRDRTSVKPYCLLLGPLGTANEEGFDWFIKNVSPNLKCKTVVAGKGFEKYKKEWENEQVKVLGYVEDLVQVYTDAACVAIPLFSGGGMKIKTAEALMFGKNVFGTTEAYEGYILERDEYGASCNTEQEFIDAINGFIDSGAEIYNKNARMAYEKKYSLEASDSSFAEALL